jgi:hypothetical protein
MEFESEILPTGNPDSGKKQHALVGCKFVVAGCDTPTLLDLVEEPFDQIAFEVQPTSRDPLLALSRSQMDL